MANDATKVDLRRLQQYRQEHRIYGINDYTWSEIYDTTIVKPSDVQKLIIDEFQPDPALDVAKLIMDALQAISGDKSGEEASAAAKVMKRGIGAGAAIAKDLGLYALEKANVSRYQDNPALALELPIKMIENILPGTFLNHYELPWLTNTQYLKANPGSWNNSEAIGTIGNMLKINNNPIDFPYVPTWKAPTQTISVENEFYLINDSEEHLVSNFKFLHIFTLKP